ncbi:hypothetical protein Slin15195_G053200 [Septoria linicola]|uniref:Uncharacterized protein n=1 Tax=Septoria linicola TaxID=215465 RepID=A0A9Q9AWL0_9PEZI|nr:hypothetical protein Slin14017_G123990 [Septoria linicola]USW52001.1 hypothetical protein Slin15195_G053200 [Septoria linicola]
MDFIKRKLSVRKQDTNHGKPEEILTPEQRVEKINDESYGSEYQRSRDGTHTRARSDSTKSKRKQIQRAPASFVKYGGPGLTAPGNMKDDPDGNAFGFGASDVPPLPSNAHVHGDAVISDFERYRLQTLSKDPVHEGLAAEREEGTKGVRFA